MQCEIVEREAHDRAIVRFSDDDVGERVGPEDGAEQAILGPFVAIGKALIGCEVGNQRVYCRGIHNGCWAELDVEHGLNRFPNATAGLSQRIMTSLPPELWPTIIRLASTTLSDLARLSALSPATRALCWSSSRDRYLFLTTTQAEGSTSAIDRLASDSALLRNPKLFPDLPGLLALFLANGGPRLGWCGPVGHNPERCLLGRICDAPLTADYDDWVYACLRQWPIPISRIEVNHVASAANRLLCRGGHPFLPLLIGIGERAARIKAVINVKLGQIVSEAPDPLPVLTELLDGSWHATSPAACAEAVGAAARRGLPEVMALGSRNGDSKLNVHAVKALMELDVRITPNVILEGLWRLFATLPECIEDEPLLAALVDVPMEHDSALPHWFPDFAWKLIDRPVLRQQLIARGILPHACLDLCLFSAADAVDELGWDGARDLALRAIGHGARSKVALERAAGVGDVGLVQLLLTIIDEFTWWRDPGVVTAMVRSQALTPEMCDLVLGAGYGVTAGAIAVVAQTTYKLLDDSDTLKILRALLDAGLQNKHAILFGLEDFPSLAGDNLAVVIKPRSFDLVIRREVEGGRVLPQVQMLLDYGFDATERDLALARSLGFVETIKLLEKNLAGRV
ncbi:hypothetical protein HK101_002852 [Irineochytrium annulatum]|nr:hypothetical protein HK101_002852 [Irineochytrium annulatum]